MTSTTQKSLRHPRISLKTETHQSENVQPTSLSSAHAFDENILLIVEVSGIEWKYEPENATGYPGECSILEADRNFR